MSECKVCKEQFHYCSSCSLDPEHPRTYGFCSWNCMMEDKDAALAALREENERLKEWKRSALEVESSWDCQAVAKVIGIPLGEDIRKHILPHILNLRSRLAAAEAKVEKVRKCVDILDSHFPDTPAYRELKQILK